MKEGIKAGKWRKGNNDGWKDGGWTNKAGKMED